MNKTRLFLLSSLGSMVGFILLLSLAMEAIPDSMLYDNHIVGFIGLLAYYGTIGLGYYIGYSDKALEE